MRGLRPNGGSGHQKSEKAFHGELPIGFMVAGEGEGNNWRGVEEFRGKGHCLTGEKLRSTQRARRKAGGHGGALHRHSWEAYGAA